MRVYGLTDTVDVVQCPKRKEEAEWNQRKREIVDH